MAIEMFDQEMMGRQLDREAAIIEVLRKHKARAIGKDVNANCVTHYVGCPLRVAKRIVEELSRMFPDAVLETRKVAFVCGGRHRSRHAGHSGQMLGRAGECFHSHSVCLPTITRRRRQVRGGGK